MNKLSTSKRMLSKFKQTTLLYVLQEPHWFSCEY